MTLREWRGGGVAVNLARGPRPKETPLIVVALGGVVSHRCHHYVEIRILEWFNYTNKII